MPFDPNSIKTFRFVRYEFDQATGSAGFYYAFDDGPLFKEEFIFPSAGSPLSPEISRALDQCLQALFLVCGVSYYKAAVPSRIIIENLEISEKTARFLEKLYFNGLGEFAYRNGLDLRSRIRFPFSPDRQDSPSAIELPRKTVVPIGGGKDSIVTLEVLKQSGEPLALYSLGSFETSQNIARTAQIPCLTVRRSLSPLLFELNAQGALNGHVPISAIIAFTLPVLALLNGFDLAALSNEKSANIGNLIYQGMEINHQYSKSLEFEEDVSTYMRDCLLSGLQYFSFLRPLSDLAIAGLFSRCPSYHGIFSSCNAAYRIHRQRPGGRWCLDCPKCRFTFLSLAPFMEKSDLLDIFGADLLGDPAQLPGYEELLGLRGNRPFECVGEEKESIAALALLAGKKDWTEDLIVRRFKEALPEALDQAEELLKKELEFSAEHRLPYRYEKLLREFIEKNEH